MVKLNTLMAEQMKQIEAGVFDMNSELSKQIIKEMQKHREALKIVRHLAVMDKARELATNEVAEMYGLTLNEVNLLVFDNAEELFEDGCFNGWFTRRSILRLSFFVPADNILAENIRTYLLNISI